jgi:crotonobetainyl-CoA:carnitine CoA-transferase CaiB-like acyl-CoA transferase
MTSALEGIRVLDVTVWQQGPYATAMMADMGADVIKIEAPKAPDPGRRFLYRPQTGLSPYGEAHNRGKRSLAIDLKHPKGKEAFLRLVRDADVVLNNLRVGAMEGLGLDYDSLKEINPRIIYVHASGYGKEGPEAGLRSFDMIGQTRGGIMWVNGEPDDPPLPMSVPQADQVGAIVAAYGTMLALFHRERTGEGQEVNVSLLGTQVALQSFNITSYLWSGHLPRRQPRGAFGPTWTTYRCGDDKYVALGMLEQRFWPGVCNALDEPDLIDDPRYKTDMDRAKNGTELIAHFDQIFATKPAREWLKRFREFDLLADLVQDYEDLVNDPQVKANGYIEDVERPGQDPLPLVGVPVKMSKTPGYVRGLAPPFGAHSREVLLERGFSEQEVDELAAEGVILVAEETAE